MTTFLVQPEYLSGQSTHHLRQDSQRRGLCLHLWCVVSGRCSGMWTLLTTGRVYDHEMPSFLSPEGIYSHSASSCSHPPTSNNSDNNTALCKLDQAIREQQTAYSDGFITLAGDFNHVQDCPSKTSPSCWFLNKRRTFCTWSFHWSLWSPRCYANASTQMESESGQTVRKQVWGQQPHTATTQTLSLLTSGSASIMWPTEKLWYSRDTRSLCQGIQANVDYKPTPQTCTLSTGVPLRASSPAAALWGVGATPTTTGKPCST